MKSIERSAVLFGLVFAACASRAPGTRPDDMSAGAHRGEAAAEARQATAHEAAYNPAATATREVGAPTRGPGEITRFETYNPTAAHLGHGREHREHAGQHAQAAQALERFEAEECRGFAPAVRAACPLMGQVAATTEIPGGVRIRFAPGVPIDAVEAHARCHLANARALGWAGMDDCPLYVRGVRVARSPDGAGLDLTSDDAATARQIRERAARHVAP